MKDLEVLLENQIELFIIKKKMLQKEEEYLKTKRIKIQSKEKKILEKNKKFLTKPDKALDRRKYLQDKYYYGGQREKRFIKTKGKSCF